MYIMREKLTPLLEECEVVMLPTTEVSVGTIMKYIMKMPNHDTDIDPSVGKLIFNKNYKITEGNQYWEPQHLYILSNEAIKIGDWVIKDKVLYQATIQDADDIAPKVIACTDPKLHRYFSPIKTNESGVQYETLLNVPKLPSDFMAAYVKHYNANTPITRLLVEYVENTEESNRINSSTLASGGFNKITTKKPNLRPDNTIIIHPIKERTFTLQDLKDAWMYRNPSYEYEWEEWYSTNYPNT